MDRRRFLKLVGKSALTYLTIGSAQPYEPQGSKDAIEKASKSTLIPRSDFYAEYNRDPSYSQLFRRELDVEPVDHIIVTQLDLPSFRYFLRDLGYLLNPFDAGNRGQDVAATKRLEGEELLGWPKERRHLKSWAIDGHIYTTAHEENDPLVSLVLGTFRQEHLGTGAGDYQRGTANFMKELKLG